MYFVRKGDCELDWYTHGSLASYTPSLLHPTSFHADAEVRVAVARMRHGCMEQRPILQDTAGRSKEGCDYSLAEDAITTSWPMTGAETTPVSCSSDAHKTDVRYSSI